MNRLRVVFVTGVLCCFLLVAGETLSGSGGDETVSPDQPGVPSVADRSTTQGTTNPTLSEARARAEMLHDLIHQTLLSVHQNYYREDEGLPLPATTLKNVFEKFAVRRRIDIRWLAVDVEPMNVDHRPQTEFEHAAVRTLKSGQPFHEETTDGQYLYAGGIRLTSECLKCHVPNRTSLRDRLAGIVISMPVSESQN